MTHGPGWGSWEEDAERKKTLGVESTIDERIAWLEEMAEIAWQSGALPKWRDPWGRWDIPQGERDVGTKTG